jgi:hypothetical protein
MPLSRRDRNAPLAAGGRHPGRKCGTPLSANNPLDLVERFFGKSTPPGSFFTVDFALLKSVLGRAESIHHDIRQNDTGFGSEVASQTTAHSLTLILEEQTKS